MKRYKKGLVFLLMTAVFVTSTGFTGLKDGQEELPYLDTEVKQEYVYHTFQLTDDPYAKYQWAFKNLGTYQYYDLLVSGRRGRAIQSVQSVDIQLEEALTYFEEYGKNREIIVAMIDTGVDTKQEDLQGHLWVNELEKSNKKDTDENGLVDDLYGWNFYDNSSVLCNYNSYDRKYDEYEDDHGTHCTGTIVATPNNGVGIAGIAGNTNVKILPIKALGGLAGEESGSGKTSSIVRAIHYAERMGAQICNLSFGGEGEDPVLEKTIKESSMLFVCAAGNDGNNLDHKPIYPASYQLPNVITVANMNSDGTLASSSNYSNRQVDLAAPGSQIVSTGVNDDYKMMTGTSMAAPMVSGVAALLYSFHEDITAEDAKQILVDSVDSRFELSGKVSSGGSLNAYKALQVSYDGTENSTAPSIQLTKASMKGDYKKKLTIAVHSKRDLVDVRIKKGEATIETFQKNGVGTVLKNIEKQNFTVKKPGVYTIYTRDRAGFETVKSIEVDFKVPNQVTTVGQSKIALLD